MVPHAKRGMLIISMFITERCLFILGSKGVSSLNYIEECVVSRPRGLLRREPQYIHFPHKSGKRAKEIHIEKKDRKSGSR